MPTLTRTNINHRHFQRRFDLQLTLVAKESHKNRVCAPKMAIDGYPGERLRQRDVDARQKIVMNPNL
jgi:hypothetical protein